MPVGVIVTAQEGTANLQIDLAARIKKEAIEASGAGVISNPSDSRVASTKAVKELIEGIPALHSQMHEIQQQTVLQ